MVTRIPLSTALAHSILNFYENQVWINLPVLIVCVTFELIVATVHLYPKFSICQRLFVILCLFLRPNHGLAPLLHSITMLCQKRLLSRAPCMMDSTRLMTMKSLREKQLNLLAMSKYKQKKVNLEMMLISYNDTPSTIAN